MTSGKIDIMKILELSGFQSPAPQPEPAAAPAEKLTSMEWLGTWLETEEKHLGGEINIQLIAYLESYYGPEPAHALNRVVVPGGLTSGVEAPAQYRFAASSRVSLTHFAPDGFLQQMKMLQIPMIDFSGKPTQEDFEKLFDRIMVHLPHVLKDAKLHIFETDHSYHGYFDRLIEDQAWKSAFMCPALAGEHAVDQGWRAACASKGYATLRITAGGEYKSKPRYHCTISP